MTAGTVVLCLVGVTVTPYTRLPFAVAACAAVLLTDHITSRNGRPSRLGARGRRWLLTLMPLLTMAGAMFIPIRDTRPSFYVVLAATAVAAGVFAVAPAVATEADRY